MSQDLDRNPVSTMDSAYEKPRDLVPASSAHAYIDYLEGCLAEIRLRLEPLEQAHADLNIAFHRRALEFESRLDNHGQRLSAIEHPTQAKNS
jgi:hypothetical protein